MRTQRESFNGFSSEAANTLRPHPHRPFVRVSGPQVDDRQPLAPIAAPSPSYAEVLAEAPAHRSEPRFAEQSPRTVGDAGPELLLDAASAIRLVMTIAAGAMRMLLKGFVGRIGGSEVRDSSCRAVREELPDQPRHQAGSEAQRQASNTGVPHGRAAHGSGQERHG